MAKKDTLPQRMLERVQCLRSTGTEWGQAFGKAWLEERIGYWPQGWGDDLEILIYGDFEPPKTRIHTESLGITIHPDKLQKTPIKSAHCVVRASVKVEERSVAALVDAARRINVLLGAWTLVEWGNSACGWWSWVTHDTGGGTVGALDHKDLLGTIDGILKLPQPVRQKVDAALYWVREPRNLFRESYRRDILRTYAAYWNAFECLVEAIHVCRPPRKSSRNKKQQSVNEFFAQRSGEHTIQNIEECYRKIINPGLPGRASYALRVCFPKREAETYITECFRAPDERQRLYDIRNAINHGEVDAENPDELIRIESRLRLLWFIVWQIFGRFLPFPVPVNPALIVENDKEQH